MRSVTINESFSGKKLDRVLREIFANMPANAMFKAFRKKEIKVNGIRVKENYIVEEGDEVEIYIIDDILFGTPLEDGSKGKKEFTVVYEDENILVVNKKQGIPVQADNEQASGTLIDLTCEYLAKNSDYDASNSNSFIPELCHRLDRNTGGLVIIAKNSKTLKIMLDKIKNKEVKKFYQCLVIGRMENPNGELKAFHIKDENNSKVFISDKKIPGSSEIITRYKTLSFKDGISKLEVELVTGKTHQIRAHLAHIDHPILGDGKYGKNSINRPLKLKQQCLWAYKIVFEFTDAGHLDYLNGKTIKVEPEFKI